MLLRPSGQSVPVSDIDNRRGCLEEAWHVDQGFQPLIPGALVEVRRVRGCSHQRHEPNGVVSRR
jgi:hypothetical protein